jgi:hypothetical protein
MFWGEFEVYKTLAHKTQNEIIHVIAVFPEDKLE